jgi:hypothetical protein
MKVTPAEIPITYGTGIHFQKNPVTGKIERERIAEGGLLGRIDG